MTCTFISYGISLTVFFVSSASPTSAGLVHAQPLQQSQRQSLGNPSQQPTALRFEKQRKHAHRASPSSTLVSPVHQRNENKSSLPPGHLTKSRYITFISEQTIRDNWPKLSARAAPIIDAIIAQPIEFDNGTRNGQRSPSDERACLSLSLLSKRSRPSGQTKRTRALRFHRAKRHGEVAQRLRSNLLHDGLHRLREHDDDRQSRSDDSSVGSFVTEPGLVQRIVSVPRGRSNRLPPTTTISVR